MYVYLPGCAVRRCWSGAGSVADSRSYQLEKPGKELYDDLAWYEGRYPSQLAAAGAAAGRQPAAAGRAYMSSRAAAAGDNEELQPYQPCKSQKF